MNVERALVSKIVQEQDIAPVVTRSITSEFFVDPENRRVFQTLIRHQSEYGQVPTLGAIRLDFPEYRFVRVDDSMDLLIDKIREAHSLSILETGLSQGVDAFDKRDTAAALAALHSTISKISADVPNSRDTNIVETGQERLAHYLSLRDLDGALLGIPTGFSTLDKATQGFQPEQLNFFVGPPKSGKTTLMLLSSIAVHLYGLRPLLMTFEMSEQEMTARMDAFRSGISHERLRSGSLKKEEWDRLERYLHQLESMPDYWMSADSNSATTLSGIAAKVDQYKPDILFIDGMYMLIDEQTGEQNTPQALTNITRGMKRMAQNKRIPVNASTQVLEWKMDKKKGITSNSIGYSSSFAQDADNIFGVEKTEDPAIQKVKVVLSRNSPPRETYIEWDWEHGKFEELQDDPFAAADGGGWDDSAGASF
jgi:replicative DNA helicase